MKGYRLYELDLLNEIGYTFYTRCKQARDTRQRLDKGEIICHYCGEVHQAMGILKLMKDVENRICSFKECLAYYDGSKIEYFYCNHDGYLYNKKIGIENPEKWSDLWYIFIPN